MGLCSCFAACLARKGNQNEGVQRKRWPFGAELCINCEGQGYSARRNQYGYSQECQHWHSSSLGRHWHSSLGSSLSPKLSADLLSLPKALQDQRVLLQNPCSPLELKAHALELMFSDVLFHPHPHLAPLAQDINILLVGLLCVRASCQLNDAYVQLIIR